MMEKTAEASLLETLARRMGCTYLSDLKYLDMDRREMLAELVRNIPAASAGCAQWNDALTYLGGEAPCADAETARAALLELLEAAA